MVKKTVKPAAKPAQQKTKEEQWRRRMAQQSQSGMSNVGTSIESADGTATALAEDGTENAGAQKSASSSTTSAKRSSVTSMSQRTASSAARGTRARLTANTLTMEEEMTYIRHDIRKLIVLSALCVAILIALVFILPSFIK